ncbi:MAG TPA: ABC transporter substrate binding protein [Desulfomonilaceae bacterium]|nr:ABC transporter substrate binding protein [Desulfomonilaceae bacterium]
MKRFVLLLLVLPVFAGIPTGARNADAATTYVAIIWEGKSEMTNRTAMGFLAKVRTLAPDLEVKQYRQLKNMQEAEQAFRESENTMNGIVFLRSSGAQFLATVDPKVPCFVGGCNNPAELGVIKNLNAPEGKITGVTYFIPYEKRFDIIKSLFPSVRAVAILVEQGHPSGLIEAQGTREQCKRLGINYEEVVATNLNTLLEGTKRVAPKVDLIIISNTRLAMDNVTNLLPILHPTKTPMFSFADAPVRSGAVAGVAADDIKLGGFLAESVVDVLIKGRPISQVPVKMDPDPKISINEPMMKSLGLNFPDAIMKKAELIQ